jgi:hypothetical protein
MVMPFGRSDAGLQSLSDYRASVVQRMRTLSRAQCGVSTIIGWCSRSTSVDGYFGVKQGEFFAEYRRDDIAPDPHGDAIGGLYRVRTLQPAHEYRHTGPPPRSNGIAVAERVFPVLSKSLAPECLRGVIVAGHSRKSSVSFGLPAIVSLREPAAV